MNGLDSFQNLEPNSLINNLINILDSSLPHFTNSDSYLKILSKKKNENQHTKAFCDFMTLRCFHGNLGSFLAPKQLKKEVVLSMLEFFIIVT